MIGMTRFKNGLTVKELKEIIKDWPEERDDGDPCEVWIGDGFGLSNQVHLVSPLNKRANDDQEWADFILEC